MTKLSVRNGLISSRRFFCLISFVLAPAPAIAEVATENDEISRGIVTPTRLVPVSEYPQFQDDLEFLNMQLAVSRQLKRFRQKRLNGTIQFGSDIYSQKVLLTTLEQFSKLSLATESCLKQAWGQWGRRRCYTLLNDEIRRSFLVYAPKLAEDDPRYGEEKDTFFTSYYTPTLKASRSPSAEYPFPVYTRPNSEKLARSTRHEIDFQSKLDGHGYELFYTNDLFDVYLLQVQGGGRVAIENEKAPESFYISFNGTNKRAWRWISRYMKQEGYIDDLTIYSQREYLDAHPEKHEEIYSTCPSYVYFKRTPHPPLGSDSVSLTDGRSIATDTSHYPLKGVLTFVRALRPKEDQLGKDPRKTPLEFKEFSRFMIDQDTGGAIKGKARVDLYHGEDDYAEMAAYNTEHTGNLFFLVAQPAAKKK